MRVFVAGTGVLMAFVLTACMPGPGALAIQLDAAVVVVVRGGSEAVGVTVTGTGADPVTLSVSGLPSNVVAAFDPPALGAGTTTSTLTVTAGAAATEGQATLTITALRGDRAANTGLSLEVESLTVTGALIGLLKEPLAGVSVAIGDSTTTSDGGGQFTVAGVAIPYDLVVYQSGASGHAHVFQGLTTASPEVLPYAALLAGHREGTIDGTLPAEVPDGSRALVCVEGLAIVVLFCDEVPSGIDSYSLDPTWVGGASVDVRVHALLMTVEADGSPTGFNGHGTANGTVTDGGATVIDVPTYTTTPAATTLTGSVSMPVGYTLQSISASATMTGLFSLLAVHAFDDAGLASNLDLVLPLLGDERYQLRATANAADSSTTVGWRSDLVPGDDVTMTLPSPPVMVSPPGGTAGVTTSTVFTISSTADAVNTFTFQPDASGPVFYVTTMEDTATIPNLSGLGVTLPSGGVDYGWAVIEARTASTPEEALFGWTGHFFDALNATQRGGPPSSGEGTITGTTSRAFTTN